MLGWGLAAATGTVAGVFTAPQLGLGTNLMQLTLIFGFAAITLGGLRLDRSVPWWAGSSSGSCPRWCPSTSTVFERMPLAPAFILILAVLLFRPEGLFGSKQVKRV